MKVPVEIGVELGPDEERPDTVEPATLVETTMPSSLRRSDQSGQAPSKVTKGGRKVRLPPRYLDPEFKTELTGGGYFALMSWIDNAPTDYASVSGRFNEKEWRQATQDETNTLEENHTWEVIKPPEKVRLISSRWIFKLKPEGAEGP